VTRDKRALAQHRNVSVKTRLRFDPAGPGAGLVFCMKTGYPVRPMQVSQAQSNPVKVNQTKK
jgi:hypothetical protein